jgi:hypothetical protein
MGRSKPDKKHKTPTKSTSSKTQKITPTKVKPDSNDITKEERQDKKINPDKTFI